MHSHSKVPPEPCFITEWRFEHVYVDLVGPSHGFTYLLTMMVRTTRVPEVLQHSEVELVLGQPLWVPGEFLTDASAC